MILSCTGVAFRCSGRFCSRPFVLGFARWRGFTGMRMSDSTCDPARGSSPETVFEICRILHRATGKHARAESAPRIERPLWSGIPRVRHQCCRRVYYGNARRISPYHVESTLPFNLLWFCKIPLAHEQWIPTEYRRWTSVHCPESWYEPIRKTKQRKRLDKESGYKREKRWLAIDFEGMIAVLQVKLKVKRFPTETELI